MMVARFTKSKDYDLFIDIARETERNRNDITFIGVGDGPERPRIQNRIKDEHINNIMLIGNRDDIETIIAASDIGLLCTYSEGISNSVIEFMALAKPVIVTDSDGGSKEVLMEGETGFCTERNAKTIIKLINLLLDDENLRTTMGNKGKERILGEFTIEKMGNNFIGLYNEVIAQRTKTLSSKKLNYPDQVSAFNNKL
jgi:glycosyltransferase involved in cell wall biosynthesis